MGEMSRFPVGREGTMARSKLRTVAGAGSVAAFLLVGGAAIPVVSADPGHSHDGHGSQQGGDSRGGNSHGGGRGRGDDGGWQRDDDFDGPAGTTGSNRWNDPSNLKPSDGANRTGTSKPNQSGVAARTGTTSRSEVVTDSPVTVVQSPVTVRRNPVANRGSTVAAKKCHRHRAEAMQE